MSKQEATRLADEAGNEIGKADPQWEVIDAAIEMLRRWPDGEPVAFDHGIGAGRFNVVKGAFWWHIRIGNSTANVGKFHSKRAAEDMALKLLTAFRDGAFLQSKVMSAPPDQSERIAALEAELARATGEGRSLAAALDVARNGILWYHDTYPDSVNDSDHDALRQIDAALQGHVATESERIAERKWLDNECLDGGCQSLKWHERIAALEEALGKIDAIRNSIIGAQKVNWSEHIYPLVAALEGAGYHGQEYEVARENLGTLLARIAALENSLAERDRVIEQARVALGWHASACSEDSIPDATVEALRAIEEVRRG